MVYALDNQQDTGEFFQARSLPLDGFTVEEDFNKLVKRYVREKTVLFPMITKEPAEADEVVELLEGSEPTAGFMSKTAVNPPENGTDFQPHAFDAPRQQVKAVGGVIKSSNYAQSLYAQQGKRWGEILVRKTDRLLTSTVKLLERALFRGDATLNPLEFNGLNKQIHPDNLLTCDMTTGDRVVQKILGILSRAMGDEDFLKNIDYVFTSFQGVRLVQLEVEQKLQYHNLEMIRPGFLVPAIIGPNGPLPIIPSPYISDVPGTGTDKDIIYFYLLDMDTVAWKGVIPQGGEKSFDPQVFDVTRFTGSATPYMVEKRMSLAYGTLLLGNRGLNCYRLAVSVANGTVNTIF
jgi:hypothetical protein